MNSLFGLSQNVFSEIKFILSSTLKKSKVEVFVFGSRATETQRQYSDLDLWIEADPPISRSELMVLSETFEDSNLPIKIDIVTPETCLDVYKERIASEKKLWFKI